jgi:hypothetical protein
LKSVVITWTKLRKHDYLTVMSEIRKAIGPRHFRQFTQLERDRGTDPLYTIKYENENPDSIAEGAEFKNSDVKIVSTWIENQNIMPSDEERAQLKQARRAILTDAFVPCLAEAAQQKPAYIFFDATEHMSDETRMWVWEELLQAVADQKLGNVRFVLCGRDQPQCDASFTWMVEKAMLKPFELGDVIEYYRKRLERERLPADELVISASAKALCDSEMMRFNRNPYPDFVFQMAFSLIELVRKEAQGSHG